MKKRNVRRGKLRILLITPPFVQLNTPYPATPQLAGWLEQYPQVEVFQRDLSLETALALLGEFGDDPYTTQAINFLRGDAPDEAETLAEPGYLPLSPAAVAEIENSGFDPDPAERAKLFCSLHLGDIAAKIQTRDPDFGFSRYAERLALCLPDFSAVLARLKSRRRTDETIRLLTAAALEEIRPDVVGVTCPFPGTLIGAFRIAATVRRLAPAALTVLGGGYVNTELRSMDDPRVKKYFDKVMLDEGYAPWSQLLAQLVPGIEPPPRIPPFVKPSYARLDLRNYLNIAETGNPMHRLWSDGRWLKIQLARGCYWRKCAFCDVTLDYIRCYEAPAAADIADAMQALAAETAYARRNGEIPGFHFTDEAIPPALAAALSRELLRRSFECEWWGNVRFDPAFTPQLARLMARAGCIAVTGGLECANDRLLALMNKGVTLAGARRTLRNFAAAGIMVHAYLMYGFPTQTRAEIRQALHYVRERFREGSIHSAYFHRFALTVHSPIARTPEKFNIRCRAPQLPRGRTFALNEIPFTEKNAPPWNSIGKRLHAALYNYMHGAGLDLPITYWLPRTAKERLTTR